MKKYNEIETFVKNAEILRPSNVEKLIGKTIRYTHPCYEANEQTIEECFVKGVIFDEKRKERRVLCVQHGWSWQADCDKIKFEHTFFFESFDACTGSYFACSDADRPVSFQIAK